MWDTYTIIKHEHVRHENLKKKIHSPSDRQSNSDETTDEDTDTRYHLIVSIYYCQK